MASGLKSARDKQETTRGPGRPPARADGVHRTERVTIRWTPDELARIDTLADSAGISSAAEWIRQRSLTTVPVTAAEVATLLEKWQWDDTSSEEQQAMALVARKLRAT